MIQVLLPFLCAVCLVHSTAPFYTTYTDGSRLLQYEAGTLARRNFREEVTRPDGTIVGRYGFHDPTGHLHVVQYHAGRQGYVAKGDTGVYYGSTQELGSVDEEKKNEQTVKESDIKGPKPEDGIIGDYDSMDEGENAKKESDVKKDAIEDTKKDEKDEKTDAMVTDATEDMEKDVKDKTTDDMDKTEDTKDASTSDDEKTVVEEKEMKDEKVKEDGKASQSKLEEPYETDPEITALFSVPEYGRRRLTISQSDKKKINEKDESGFYTSHNIFNAPISPGFVKWNDPQNQPLSWPHPVFRFQDSSTGQYIPFEHPWIIGKPVTKDKKPVQNTFPFHYVGSQKKEFTSQDINRGDISPLKTTTFQYTHPSRFYYPQPVLPFAHIPDKSPFFVPGYPLYA